jgi:hypothetical protein
MYRSPRVTALRMLMRDRVVPYSFPAHRTKAKMLSASKETIRLAVVDVLIDASIESDSVLDLFLDP